MKGCKPEKGCANLAYGMHAGARLQREVEREDEGHGASARGAHGISRQVPPVSVRQYLPQRTHPLWPQARTTVSSEEDSVV